MSFQLLFCDQIPKHNTRNMLPNRVTISIVKTTLRSSQENAD